MAACCMEHHSGTAHCVLSTTFSCMGSCFLSRTLGAFIHSEATSSLAKCYLKQRESDLVSLLPSMLPFSGVINSLEMISESFVCFLRVIKHLLGDTSVCSPNAFLASFKLNAFGGGSALTKWNKMCNLLF